MLYSVDLFQNAKDVDVRIEDSSPDRYIYIRH